MLYSYYQHQQPKLHNLFRTVENKIEQRFAAHIVQCCQKYCLALLNLDQPAIRCNNAEQCWQQNFDQCCFQQPLTGCAFLLYTRKKIRNCWKQNATISQYCQTILFGIGTPDSDYSGSSFNHVTMFPQQQLLHPVFKTCYNL